MTALNMIMRLFTQIVMHPAVQDAVSTIARSVARQATVALVREVQNRTRKTRKVPTVR